MIGKLLTWIHDFKLYGFVNSALRKGIIAKHDGGVGIDQDVFSEYIEIVPYYLRDDFVDRISNMTVEAKMNFEVEKQMKEAYVDKIKELILVNPKAKRSVDKNWPIGNVMFGGDQR